MKSGNVLGTNMVNVGKEDAKTAHNRAEHGNSVAIRRIRNRFIAFCYTYPRRITPIIRRVDVLL